MPPIILLTHKGPKNGLGRVAHETFQAIRRLRPELDVRLWHMDWPRRIVDEHSADGIHPRVSASGFHAYAFYWNVARRIPAKAQVHVTNQNLSFLPVHRPVITVMDLYRLTHAGYASRLVARGMYSGIPQARRLVAISHFTESEILRTYGARAPPSTVAPLGVNEFMREVDSRPSPMAAPYLLHVSTETPRKRFDLALRAFALFRERTPSSPLILLKAGRAETPQLRIHHVQLVRRLGLEGHVVFEDDVSDERLRNFYRHARALLCPSSYEGFGLPAAEAMAQGCPVLATDATSLPEVVGEGGMLLDDDVGRWADAIAISEDAAWRKRSSAQALQQSRRFTWQETAQRTLDAYAAGGFR